MSDGEGGCCVSGLELILGFILVGIGLAKNPVHHVFFVLPAAEHFAFFGSCVLSHPFFFYLKFFLSSFLEIEIELLFLFLLSPSVELFTVNTYKPCMLGDARSLHNLSLRPELEEDSERTLLFCPTNPSLPTSCRSRFPSSMPCSLAPCLEQHHWCTSIRESKSSVPSSFLPLLFCSLLPFFVMILAQLLQSFFRFHFFLILPSFPRFHSPDSLKLSSLHSP
jgi:hypothetical protein